MSVEISTRMDGNIAVISISNLPVNALSADVRRGVFESPLQVQAAWLLWMLKSILTHLMKAKG